MKYLVLLLVLLVGLAGCGLFGDSNEDVEDSLDEVEIADETEDLAYDGDVEVEEEIGMEEDPVVDETVQAVECDVPVGFTANSELVDSVNCRYSEIEYVGSTASMPVDFAYSEAFCEQASMIVVEDSLVISRVSATASVMYDGSSWIETSSINIIDSIVCTEE